MELSLLSMNIHKGVSGVLKKQILFELKKAIQSTNANLVCLQEVQGRHLFTDKIKETQFEYLADQVWPYFSYGKNAVYTDTDHGNAILSCYPILKTENIDISQHKVEQRGILHVEIGEPRLHILNLHLGLFSDWREKQMESLIWRIQNHIPSTDAFLVAGDFNDWPGHLGQKIMTELGAHEASIDGHGHSLRTFPSFFPLLKLDRIYYRGLKLKSCEVLTGSPWNRLSDHLPLISTFEL